MAQTPFSPTPTTYFGQLGAEAIDSTGTFRRFWLGKAGSMIQLPSPAIGYTVESDSGEVEHKLISGGTAVTRHGTPKRRYTMQWGRLGNRDFQIVRGFYRRAYGPGPYLLVTPEDGNRLSGSASLMGGTNGDISAWSANAAPGTLSAASGVASGIYPSGVIAWAGSTTGSQASLVLDMGSATTPGTATPLLPAEPLTFSVYAATATGTATIQIYLQTRDATGAFANQLGSAGLTVTTTPTRLSFSTIPGALGLSMWVVPIFVQLTATAPTIYFSAPQLEYEPAPTPWQIGRNVPRVVIPSAMSRTVDPRMFSNTSLIFAEV
jgi:hypothetical protein